MSAGEKKRLLELKIYELISNHNYRKWRIFWIGNRKIQTLESSDEKNENGVILRKGDRKSN